MAGTVTLTETTLANVKKLTFAWVASAGGAADKTTTESYTGTISAYTVPGTGTPPSGNYDIRLLDSANVDVANALLLNRSAVNTEWVGDTNTGKVVASTLTLEVRNAGAGGEGTLVVYVSPVGLVTATTTETQIYATQPRIATATSSSPLTTGTLWTFTGSIKILEIFGRVTTQIQAQATSVKLGIIADALAEQDITTAGLNMNGFVAGTLIAHAGKGNAMNGTSGEALQEDGHVCLATCTTSGTIKVTYGAASTGAIAWYMLWQPLSSGATVV